MASTNSCKLGICGLGTVGAGLFNLLATRAEDIRTKTGISLSLAQVACRREPPECDLSSTRVSRDIFDLARNPEIDILVELIGGTEDAKALLLEAMSQGKHVVTANKALIALHGEELFRAAAAQGVQLRYEAAVAGGIPIIKAIREGLVANRIEWLLGIINGTSNFILTEMGPGGKHRTFEQVLADAQQLGYAEADPTFDIEGIDAAHKLTILASLAFGLPLPFAAVATEGISSLTQDDIRFADELGYRIRHLGIARRQSYPDRTAIELRVHPALLPKAHLLAQVDGVMNAVMVGADAAGATMYYGPGAGAAPTASAVLADVVDIARCLVNESVNKSVNKSANNSVHKSSEHALPYQILPPAEWESANYLRLGVRDRAGVMAKVTTILSNHKVNIEALLQKDVQSSDTQIVILTNNVLEGDLNHAIRELEALDDMTASVVRIRLVDGVHAEDKRAEDSHIEDKHATSAA